MSFEKYFILRSSQRLSGTSSNFTLNLTSRMRETKYKLNLAAIPVSWYNVNSTNNVFYFSDNGIPRVATITAGFYDANSLPTALQTAMNAAGSQTYTVTYSSSTGRLTIAAGSGFTITMASNTTNSAAVITGFNSDLGSATSQTAPNMMNLTPIISIGIQINSENNFQDSAFNSYTIYVPVEGMTGSWLYYTPPENFPQIVDFSRIRQSLQVSIRDNNYNVVDLNGLDWELVFERMDG